MTAEKPKVVVIEPDTEVYYPEDERVELERCLSLQGFIKQAIEYTGLSKNTIAKYAQPNGKGQKKKVNALRQFVKAFNQAAA